MKVEEISIKVTVTLQTVMKFSEEIVYAISYLLLIFQGKTLFSDKQTDREASRRETQKIGNRIAMTGG